MSSGTVNTGFALNNLEINVTALHGGLQLECFLHPYIAENGMLMVMWIGMQFPPDLVMKVFGVPSSAQVNTEMVRHATYLTLAVMVPFIHAGNEATSLLQPGLHEWDCEPC